MIQLWRGVPSIFSSFGEEYLAYFLLLERSTLHISLLKVDPTSLGVASAGSGVELGLADPASLAWEDNLVATALNLSTPEIRCFSPKKVT